ncbi:LEVG family PEP-CTERM protein [Mastigocladopsis repens]|uniref:LEVG family PEP-CTERM protein n=1 Tax=Mastigocladopsis repens TaxID=221287 RepID=UPI0003067A16|nr:LEVG family PEP-CTERM protein [Mastigocladopsis repens]
MRKFNFVAATILGTTMSLGVVTSMPAADASSLVPQQEGEIQLTNIDCIASTCIDLEKDFGFKVTSLAYDFDSKEPQYGLSRLFVDEGVTENDWGFGIKFGIQDPGTNPPANEYSYRPVAYEATSADAAPTATSTAAENGQLEVGRFLFDLGSTYSEVTLDFFDVEDSDVSGVLEVNGTPVEQLLAGESNSNTKSITLKNVSSFVVQLGKPGPDSTFDKTGDGVRLSGVTVPEPGTTVSLGMLAVAGLFGLRQRKKVSQLG